MAHIFALVFPGETRVMQYETEPFPVAEPFRWHLIENYDPDPKFYYEYEDGKIIKKEIVFKKGVLEL